MRVRQMINLQGVVARVVAPRTGNSELLMKVARAVAAAVKREDARLLRQANTLAPDRAGRNLLWQASKLEHQAEFIERPADQPSQEYHFHLRPADVGDSDIVIHAGKVSEVPPHVVDTYDREWEWVGSTYFKSKRKARAFLRKR